MYPAAYLGGPLAASYLLSRNYLVFGEKDAAKKALLWGVLLTIVLGIVLRILSPILDAIPHLLIPNLYCAAAFSLTKFLQDKKITEYLEKGAQKASYWRASAIGLLCAIPTITILVIVMFCATFLKYKLDYFEFLHDRCQQYTATNSKNTHEYVKVDATCFIYQNLKDKGFTLQQIDQVIKLKFAFLDQTGNITHLATGEMIRTTDQDPSSYITQHQTLHLSPDQIQQILTQEDLYHQSIDLTPVQATPSASVDSLLFTLPSVPVQKWLLAAGGVISAQNREGFDQLKVNTDPEMVKKILTQGWNVQSREDALKMLGWLQTTGHTAEFDQMRAYLLEKTHGDSTVYQASKSQLITDMGLQNTPAQIFLLDFVWQHRDDLAEKKLFAWDNMRMIAVARWSYTAGYISENEAWAYMLYAGKQLQSHYTSWDDLEKNYLLGRAFWSHSNDASALQDGLNWLHTNPASPWKTIPWEISLDEK